MTPEQKILCAIARKKNDGLPVDIGFSNEETKRQYAAAFHMSEEEFSAYVGSNDFQPLYLMEDIFCFLKNQRLVEFAVENGFAFPAPDRNLVYDRWGVGWELAGGYGQRPVVHPLDTIEALRNYQPPDLNIPGMFYQAEQQLNKLKQAGFATRIAQFLSLFEKAWVLMGYENFFIHYHEHRQAVESLLDKITEYRVAMAEKIATYDTTCGHTGDDYGLQTGPAMSLAMWRELFKPRLARIWSVYKKHRIPVMHHSCGDCRMFLEDMIEIGLDVLHPVQASAMPIEDLQQKFGSRLTFYGGIDCQDVLQKGSPDDVRDNVRKTVEILGQNNGLILGALNIMPDMPKANIEALLESVHSYKTHRSQ